MNAEDCTIFIHEGGFLGQDDFAANGTEHAGWSRARSPTGTVVAKIRRAAMLLKKEILVFGAISRPEKCPEVVLV